MNRIEFDSNALFKSKYNTNSCHIHIQFSAKRMRYLIKSEWEKDHHPMQSDQLSSTEPIRNFLYRDNPKHHKKSSAATITFSVKIERCTCVIVQQLTINVKHKKL